MAVKKVASDEMIKTIAEVSDKIDGVIISYSPDTVSVLREFVQKVRGK
jgi:Holliday junction resolvasome RuvABC endonuclease subunit